MARTLNNLTDAQVRKATTEGKAQRKLADGGGLTLVVRPDSKYWWFRYRFNGKEQTLSLGTYPAVGLKIARGERDKAKHLVSQGINPITEKKVAATSRQREQENTFKTVAMDWYEQVHSQKVAPTTHPKNLRRLEMYAFPLIGQMPMAEIEPPDVLEVLRRIQKQGHVDNAHRLKTLIGQVFRYGVSTGKAGRDVTADLRGILPPPDVNHHAAIVDPKEVGKLLRAIDNYRGSPTVIAALKLAPMFFLRPGNLRKMKWDEIDWDENTWSTEVTKNGEPLIVPLASQAIEVLKELQALNDRQEWVFPSHHGKGRPMSDNGVRTALIRMGFKGEMTPHGFRAMAKTILTERLNFRTEIIEMQMAHRVRDVHGRAYNRTTWLPERKEMMQQWADYLDALREPGSIVTPIHKSHWCSGQVTLDTSIPT